MNDFSAVFGNILAQWREYGWGPGMMGGGWGYGMGWFGGLMMLAFWALVIVGLVFLIRWLALMGRERRGEDSALEILKQRYAKGEISKEEFEEKKKDLR
jgi:putative membrane protein